MMKLAPKIVSIRVVNTSMPSDASRASDSANRTRAPSERPIQFRCIVSTFSGHWLRPSAALSSSSAYRVIRKNHCSSSRVTTGVPQRQHPPSTTCSLAKTVLQLGHQFTLDRRRNARSRSSIFRNIHWFHL